MRLALSLLAFVGVATAQSALTIQDRNAIFQYSSYPTSTTDTGGRVIFNTSTANHLAASWWYYQVSGDATGSAFNSSNGQLTATLSSDRKSGTLDWADVDGRMFAARLVNRLYSTGSTTGVSTQAMTITNNTGAALTITVYSYADIDIDGISSDDSASQVANLPAGQTRVTDPSFNSVFFMGNGYQAWEAAVFPTLRDNILTTSHQLANGTLPMNMQDYTGAFSWTLTLPPNASETLHSLLAINYQPRSQNVAEATPYGAAKAGTPGLAEWVLNRPFAGQSVPLAIGNGLTGAAPIVVIGTSQTNVPLPPFGTIYVLPVTSFSMAPFDGTGVSSLPLQVPNLSSGTVHFQTFWADSGAAGGIAHSSGLTWSIGSF
ncbi:MAG: hypothetical protein R3F56_20440 [Planctomycetota bacterium]